MHRHHMHADSRKYKNKRLQTKEMKREYKSNKTFSGQDTKKKEKKKEKNEKKESNVKRTKWNEPTSQEKQMERERKNK